MNITIEKVEELFSDTKENPGALSEMFFEATWPLVVMLSKKGKVDLAEKIYDWAASIEDTHPKIIAYAKLTLGLAAFQNEEYEQSLDYCTKAQKLFVSLADYDGEMMCNTLIGMVYRPLGDIELTLKYLLDVYPVIS